MKDFCLNLAHFDSSSNTFSLNIKLFYFSCLSPWPSGRIYKILGNFIMILLAVFWAVNVVGMLKYVWPFVFDKFMEMLGYNLMHLMGVCRMFYIVSFTNLNLFFNKLAHLLGKRQTRLFWNHRIHQCATIQTERWRSFWVKKSKFSIKLQNCWIAYILWLLSHGFLHPVFIAFDCRSEGNYFQRWRALPLLSHVHANFIVDVGFINLVYCQQLSSFKFDKLRGNWI